MHAGPVSACTIAAKTGRKIHVIPLPAWLARFNQALATPFSAPAANIFALMGFVAADQPRWTSNEVVSRFKLPKQLTVSDYLDLNYPGPEARARPPAGRLRNRRARA